jgi:hypothetical protein
MHAFKPTIVSKEKGRDPQGRKETETKAHTGTNSPAMTVKYAPEEGQKARRSAGQQGPEEAQGQSQGQKARRKTSRRTATILRFGHLSRRANATDRKIQSERCNSVKETESVVIPTDKGVEQKNPIGEM